MLSILGVDRLCQTLYCKESVGAARETQPECSTSERPSATCRNCTVLDPLVYHHLSLFIAFPFSDSFLSFRTIDNDDRPLPQRHDHSIKSYGRFPNGLVYVFVWSDHYMLMCRVSDRSWHRDLPVTVIHTDSLCAPSNHTLCSPSYIISTIIPSQYGNATQPRGVRCRFGTHWQQMRFKFL